MKNNLIAFGVILALILGAVGIFTPAGQKTVQTLGSVVSFEQVDNPKTNIGGTQEFQQTIPFTATSSFIYSLKNPFGATSTIEAITMTGNSLIGTNPIYVSTSTTAFGTSTPALVAALAMASKAAFTFVWVKNTATTTAVGSPYSTGNPDILPCSSWRGSTGINNVGISTSNCILGPAEFLNINIATSTAGTFGTYMTGSGVTVKLRKL